MADDNPSDVELTKLALGELNLPNPLFKISCGQGLIEYLENEENLDLTVLILLDLDLSTLNGISFLIYAASQNWLEKINLVVFTTRASDEQIKVCKDLGVQSLMIKPTKLDEYFTSLQRLSTYWLFEPALRN